jgi:hypothetical protein
MNQLVRFAALATAFSSVVTSVALAQRSRGTMGGAPAVTQQPPAPAPSSIPRGGTMSVPMYGPRDYGPRGGNLPRIVTEPPRRQGYGYGYGLAGSTGYSSRDRDGRLFWYDENDRDNRGYRSDRDDRGDRSDRTIRYSRPGYTTYSPYVRRPIPCGIGCVRFAGGLRSGRVFGSFVIGYPFYVPIVVPYIYDATYVRYGEPAADSYAPPPATDQPASKLIVIGAGTGGGDALTVETRGDSVRLSWIGANRAAREVRLFVSDSAQQQLASRRASPTAPTATFEIATLSAPVAFAGVSVTFTDGVTSTTVVPYRNGSATGPRR